MIGQAPGEDPTRELFVPATGTIGGTIAYTGTARAAVVLAGANQRALGSFFVPADFKAIIEAVIIVNPTATKAAANWDITTKCAAAGEAENTHEQTDAASTYNVMASQLFEVDISGLLTGMLAGDYCGFVLMEGTAGDNVDVIGFRLKY